MTDSKQSFVVSVSLYLLYDNKASSQSIPVGGSSSYARSCVERQEEEEFPECSATRQFVFCCETICV